MTLNATTISAERSTFSPDASENLRSITSPGDRSTARTGALALVPPGASGGGAALLKTFIFTAQQDGPAAAIKSLLNNKSAGPLQALIKTPPGRMALAVAALGFSAGWVVGSNAPKVQALVTALKSISDQNLPPLRAAQQISQVLRAAVMPAKTAPPAAPDRTAENRRVQSLMTSLDNTRADLKETARLLKLRPGDQDLQTIVKGQAAKVRDLQTKVDALKPSPDRKPVETVRRLPNKIEELSPWLQDQVRNRNMGFNDAVTITKNEWIRRSTMPEAELPPSEPPKSCDVTVETENAHTESNGKIETESSVHGTVRGSRQTTSVEIDVKVRNPTTNRIMGKDKASVPGRSAEVHIHTEMTGAYEYPNKPTPIVEVKASCKFTDGTKMPATVHQSRNDF